MPDEMNPENLTEYDSGPSSGSTTPHLPARPRLQKDLADGESLTIGSERYGTSKPKRIVIRATVAHDKS
jgi:hypothetical protein